MYRRDCSPAPGDARGNVCGIRSDDNDGFALHIQRENIYLYVLFSGDAMTGGDNPTEWLEQRMAEATEHILAQLDRAP